MTDERINEGYESSSEAARNLYTIHVGTYSYILQHVEGKSVLDYGCGEGYGSYMLSKKCKEITAVDISESSVIRASRKYQASNLQYLTLKNSADALEKFGRERFDVIVSSQVVEHIKDDESYIKDTYALLKPGGTFICITPDRANRLLPFQSPWNRWHIREYSDKSLLKVMKCCFEVIEIFYMGGQSPAAAREVKRTKKLKWLMLCFTALPLPFRARWVILSLASILRSALPKNTYPHSSTGALDPDYAKFPQISKSRKNSVNLVALAYKHVS